jgi:hypothetical protein
MITTNFETFAQRSKEMAWTKTPSQKIDGDGVSSQWEGEHVRFEEPGSPQHQGYIGGARVGNPYHYTASFGRHRCIKKESGFFIFYVLKEGGKSGLRLNSENVPHGRQDEFCPNCRQIQTESERLRVLGPRAGTSKKVDYWQCLCSY